MGQDADYEARRYDWANNPTDQWGGPAHNADGTPSTQYRVPGTNVPAATGAGGKYGPTMQPDSWDPLAFGGTRAQGDYDYTKYEGMGTQLRDRAPTIDYTGGNRYSGMADESRGLGMGSRGSQQDALGLMRSAAMGSAPSQAEIQQRQGMQDAMAGQLAIAAGARGASGIAQAQTNLGGNTAALQRQQAIQGSALRAQEMAHARDAYMGGSSAIRGQDFQQRGQDFQAQGMQDARSTADARLRFDYGGRGLQYDQLAWNTRNAQLGGELDRRRLDDSRVSARMGHDFQRDQANQANGWKAAGAVASLGSGAMAGASVGDKPAEKKP
jgi:hypothetical protein